MKKTLSICLIMAGFVGASAAAEPHMFLPNFEDVPAAAGCVPENSEGFLFSVPEGRIVETIVHCGDNLTRRQFQRFYRDSMKGLGWEIKKDESKVQEFHRAGDILKIEILNTDPVEARFSLTPSDAPEGK